MVVCLLYLTLQCPGLTCFYLPFMSCLSLSLRFLLSVVTKDGVFVLDMAAKIDATADYLCKAKWGDVEFPPPFGREAYPEVRTIT